MELKLLSRNKKIKEPEGKFGNTCQGGGGIAFYLFLFDKTEADKTYGNAD